MNPRCAINAHTISSRARAACAHDLDEQGRNSRESLSGNGGRDVGINIGRNGDVSVTKDLLQNAHFDPSRDRGGGHRVTQPMQPDVREAASRGRGVEGVAELLGAVRRPIVEAKDVYSPGPATAQRGKRSPHRGRESEDTTTGGGLRRTFNDLTGDADALIADVDLRSVQVHVCPAEAEQLAAAQAEAGCEEPNGVEILAALGLQEARKRFWRPEGRGPLLMAGRPDEGGGVRRDQTHAEGIGEGGAEDNEGYLGLASLAPRTKWGQTRQDPDGRELFQAQGPDDGPDVMEQCGLVSTDC